MAWLTANWIWIVVLIAFIAMHMFGHGAHGGRGDHSGYGGGKTMDEVQDRVANKGSSAHHN